MPHPAYPLLRNEADGSETALAGRIFTFGGSRDCGLTLSGSGLPAVVGHFLFREGSYQVQALTQNLRIKVNDKEISGAAKLRHNDRLQLGQAVFRFLQEPAATRETGEAGEAAAPGTPGTQPLTDLIDAVVTLLRERDSDVFHSLVLCVSRLLRCDAARVVEEDPATNARSTIARYPSHSGLERFSDRAIDWSKESAHAVLLNETDWEDQNSITSLHKNAVASVLCVALREGEGIIGYLYMDRLGGTLPFSEKERELCDSLGRLFGEILSHRKALSRQKEAIARLQSNSLATGSGIIHSCPAMVKVLDLAMRIARTDATVIIRGETGTGKEVLARFLHANSVRTGKPFYALNCGAIPENLIESELFGHEKGAFTGADQRKIGLFESAHDGTLFLDEIGDLPLNLQVKLLRVLQESEITRLGSPNPVKVNVRILSATHRTLANEVKEGRFRQDLYFRLSVLELDLPPLRDRGQDVLLLADFILKKYLQQFGLPAKSLTPAARNKLLGYAFPGNVRELENVIQKAILLSDAKQINADDLQWEAEGAPGERPRTSIKTLKEIRFQAEKEAIDAALSKTAGNVSLAAKMLEVDRKWLMKLIEEAGLNADDYRK
ncbi:MAG: Response regulator of zinc sigma-54-dependent two-component system [Fibrobacteres bacterium]|nr:Response regulator of zinc sigma-54-dependent two-component system [Fibrobacterota bacterium]